MISPEQWHTIRLTAMGTVLELSPATGHLLTLG